MNPGGEPPASLSSRGPAPIAGSRHDLGAPLESGERRGGRSILDAWLGPRLIAFTDGLFGEGADEPVAARRAGAIFLLTSLALLAMLVLRRPDALLNPQFWGDDGLVFFRQQLQLGFGKALLQFHQGFPYLVPRVVAAFAGLFRVDAAPLIYNLAALVIAATTSAWFSLPHFRHVVRNPALRLIFCAVIVAAIGGRETVGVLSNAQWYLGIWAILTALMRLPRSGWGRMLILGASAVSLFSSPIALLATPLWVLRALRASLQRAPHEQSAAKLVLGTAMLVFVMTNYYAPLQLGRVIPVAVPKLIATRVVAEALIGPGGARAGIERLGPQFAYLIAGAALLCAVGALAWLRFDGLPLVGACCWAIAGSVVGTLMTDVRWNQIGSRMDAIYGSIGAERHLFSPGIAMTCLGVFVLVDRLQARWLSANVGVNRAWFRRLGWLAPLSIVALMTAASVPGFRLAPFVDLHWQRYAEQLATKIERGSHRPLVIPINPPPTSLPIDLALVTDVMVSPDGTVGELAGGQELAQTFTSRCDSLNLVELQVATYERSIAQPLVLRLTDGLTGEVVAEGQVAGPSLRDNAWQSLAFEPFAGSSGRRFRITIALPGSTPGEGITLYRSAGDAYRGGEASLNGRPIGADILFRYGCAR